jgi:beta-lactamase class A
MRGLMRTNPRSRPLHFLTVALLFGLIGCKNDATQTNLPAVSGATASAAQPSNAVTIELKPMTLPPAQPVADTPTIATPQSQTRSQAQETPPVETPSQTVLGENQVCAMPPQTTRIAPPTTPKTITGRVGLYVALFPKGSSDFAPAKVISINPSLQFPLASNFKQSVLLEVLRQADAGTLKLTEKFNITRANQSLGWYPYDGSPVMELARRMIQFSDNTATDTLFRRVGLGSLQPLADELGLCHTRLQLPTKAWWTAQAGFGGPDFPKYALVSASRSFAQAPFEKRLEIAQRLDAAAQRVGPDALTRAVEVYFGGRNGGRDTMSEIDRNLQNASTPFEWARFIHAEFLTNKLSAVNHQRFRETMALGSGRYLLKVPFAYYGGKSGNTARLLTHSGYLETKSGDRLIYVYMNDTSQNPATREETPIVYKFISAALAKLMRPADLIPDKKKAVTTPPIDPRELEYNAPRTKKPRS